MSNREWLGIETVPPGRVVELKSTSGIECDGYVSGTFRKPRAAVKVRKADAYGPDRVRCKRYDDTTKTGDISAVAWKEVE